MKRMSVILFTSMLGLQIGCAKQMLGSPDSNAMLIVGCADISWTISSRWIESRVSNNKEDYCEPTDCWVAQAGEKHRIKAIALDRSSGQPRCFVFPNLKPGEYHLSTICAKCQVRSPNPSDPLDQEEYRTFFYEFPVSEYPEFTGSFSPGEIKFLGIIELGVKHRDYDEKLEDIEVNREDKLTYFSLSVSDEPSVLRRVLDADSDSPWVPALHSRLKEIGELKQHTN